MNPVKVICIECNSIQNAVVEDAIPWPIYIHTCTNCGYVIDESEWNELKTVPLSSIKSFDTFTIPGHETVLCTLSITKGNTIGVIPSNDHQEKEGIIWLPRNQPVIEVPFTPCAACDYPYCKEFGCALPTTNVC